MSIDWLPREETRRFPRSVYTEPCWTRIIKEKLRDRKVAMDGIYDIFTKHEEESKILAEGNFTKAFKLNKSTTATQLRIWCNRMMIV